MQGTKSERSERPGLGRSRAAGPSQPPGGAHGPHTGSDPRFTSAGTRPTVSDSGGDASRGRLRPGSMWSATRERGRGRSQPEAEAGGASSPRPRLNQGGPRPRPRPTTRGPGGARENRLPALGRLAGHRGAESNLLSWDPRKLVPGDATFFLRPTSQAWSRLAGRHANPLPEGLNAVQASRRASVSRRGASHRDRAVDEGAARTTW